MRSKLFIFLLKEKHNATSSHKKVSLIKNIQHIKKNYEVKLILVIIFVFI